MARVQREEWAPGLSWVYPFTIYVVGCLGSLIYDGWIYVYFNVRMDWKDEVSGVVDCVTCPRL
jgi:hypothetical protein